MNNKVAFAGYILASLAGICLIKGLVIISTERGN